MHQGLDCTQFCYLVDFRTPQLCVWLPETIIELKSIWNRRMSSYCNNQNTWVRERWHLKFFSNRSIFGNLYVYSFVPCSIAPPIWPMFQVFLVFFDHMHISKVSVCSNHGPIPNVLCSFFLNATFMAWRKYGMHDVQNSIWRQKYHGGACVRDHNPLSIPYVYGVDDWVVIWCTILVYLMI